MAAAPFIPVTNSCTQSMIRVGTPRPGGAEIQAPGGEGRSCATVVPEGTTMVANFQACDRSDASKLVGGLLMRVQKRPELVFSENVTMAGH